MRRWLIVLCVVMIAVIGLNPAVAYTVRGVGAYSCGAWVNERNDITRHNLQLHWILGFLSAVGWMSPNNDDPFEGVDADAVELWIDNYCKKHPLEKIVDAAEAFYEAHPHK